MTKKATYYKLFYFGLIVFSTYYFLFHNIQITNYDDHVGAFWLDPYKDSIITLQDLEIAILLILLVIVIELKDRKIIQFYSKDILKFGSTKYVAYTIIALVAMSGLQVYTLLATDLPLEPLTKTDFKPQHGWEENISEVLNYLKLGESGNVLSLHAPAISFFTNRTNFELYDPFTFSKISPVLETEDPDLFKQKILQLNIKYIVIPNQYSTLYKETQNALNHFSAMKIIQSDPDFIKVSLRSYDIYKFDKTPGINLISNRDRWTSVEEAKISYDDETLNIKVNTEHTEKSYNRVVQKINLNLGVPSVLSFEYATESLHGDAVFYAEIIDTKTRSIRWEKTLENTNGKTAIETFYLSKIGRHPIELKLYIITEGPGEHKFSIEKAIIKHI
jgi:hypothetical protein